MPSRSDDQRSSDDVPGMDAKRRSLLTPVALEP